MEVTILRHRVVGYIWTAPEKAFGLCRKHRTLGWSGFAARRLITLRTSLRFPFTMHHPYNSMGCLSIVIRSWYQQSYLIVFHCELNGSVIGRYFLFSFRQRKRTVIRSPVMCACSTLDYVWNFQVSCFVNVTSERFKRIQFLDTLKKLNFNMLCYKSEGRWFDPSWCHWNFSLT